ncbi:zinc finger protein [Theobroma cacao]|nr:zinc finger protein [Theobroma cacao]
MPITIIIEFIRDMFQCWFHDRHKEAVKVTTPLNPWAVIKPIDQVEVEVKNGRNDGLVNLSTKTCSCYEFQLDLLLCNHVIATISKCKRKVVDFCSDYYKTTYLVEGYVGSIHPIGHSSD